MNFIKKTRPLIWFLIALVFFLSAGTALLVSQLRAQLLEQVSDHADRELHLLGAIVTEDLVRHDYAAVGGTLTAFGALYEDIYEIKVTAPDGSVVADHRRPVRTDHSLVRSYCVDIEPPARKCMDIELVHDLGPIQRHISDITSRAIFAAVLFAGLMGAILWNILRRTAFMPLERAVADLHAANENLEVRVAQRTADWMLANKELKEEIEEREAAKAAHRMVLENISEIIYLVSLDDGGAMPGTVSFVSGQVAEIVGRRAEEFLNDPGLWVSLIHHDDMPAVREATARLIRERVTVTRLYRVLNRETQDPVWIEDRIVPQFDAGGNVIGYFGAARDITRRKLAEDGLKSALALAQAEKNKSDAIVAAIGDGISIQDRDFTVLYQNEYHRQMIGDHVGAFCYHAYEGRDSVCPGCPVALAFADGKVHTVERTGKTENGPVHAEITASPLRDPSGAVIAGIEVARNITERKRTEEELRRTSETQSVINRLLSISLDEQSLDEVLRQALDIILSSSRYVQHSIGGILLTEGDRKELAMKVQRGFHPSVQEACKLLPFGTCLCGRAAATQQVQFSSTLDDRHEIRFPGIEPHGHYCVPIMMSGRTLGVLSLYLEDGHRHDPREEEFLVAVTHALGGIIERKRMAEEREQMISDLRHLLDTISASRREWQETFDSIRDMISIHGEDYTIMRANRAFAQNFGLEPRDVINRKCYELFHKGSSPVHQCPHHRTLDSREPVTEEISDPASGRIFLVSTFPYSSSGTGIRGTIHIARDITEMKEKEMQLIMSERLAALGQMASGIAHEINNPLAAIAGCVDGLGRRINRNEYDPELFRKYLGIIKEEITRSKNITTSMLSVVRKSSYEKKQVNIIEALEKALEIIGFQGRLKHMEVLKRYPDRVPAVYGSEGELKQVFLIVLTNALDAMEDEGTLTLETSIASEKLSIDITDTGPGIAPELRKRVFDPFFTTKTERGGTGLGLSIASRIMTSHDGGIEILSGKNSGTTIRITLPA